MVKTQFNVERPQVITVNKAIAFYVEITSLFKFSSFGLLFYIFFKQESTSEEVEA